MMKREKIRREENYGGWADDKGREAAQRAKQGCVWTGSGFDWLGD